MAKISRMKSIKIDGEKLRAAIDAQPLPMNDISKFVLGADGSYLSKSVNNSVINPESYRILCEFLKLNPEDYLITEEKKEEKAPAESADGMVVAVNSLYNRVNMCLAEIKTQQTLTKEQITVEKQILEILKSVNSNLNTNTEKVKAIFTDVHYNK